MLSHLQAVVFDFDGVITDSESVHLRAFQDVLEPEGIRLESGEYYARYLGFDDHGAFSAIARDRGVHLDDPAIAMLMTRKAERFQQLGSGAPVLFEGVAEKVRVWSETVPLAIASGALRAEIEHVLKVSGLRPCFRAIVGADNVPRGKPSPDPYWRAVQLLNEAHVDPDPQSPIPDPRSPIPAWRCVAIEDSQWGIDSAHAAGLRTVGITNSYPAEELKGADLIVSSFADLTLERLDRLWGDGVKG